MFQYIFNALHKKKYVESMILFAKMLLNLYNENSTFKMDTL